MKKAIKLLAAMLAVLTVVFCFSACQEEPPVEASDYTKLETNQVLIGKTVFTFPVSIYNLPVMRAMTGEMEKDVNGCDFRFTGLKYYPSTSETEDGLDTSFEYLYFDIDENSNIQAVHIDHELINEGGDLFFLGGLTVGMTEDEVINLKGEGTVRKHYSGQTIDDRMRQITYYVGESGTLAVAYNKQKIVTSITTLYGNDQPVLN